jgi:hypothetical protein
MENHSILTNLILERERIDLLRQLINERFPERHGDLTDKDSNKPE